MPSSHPHHDPKVPKAITASTSRVTMDDLKDKGLSDLRVLSESKFLHLVNRLVEAEVSKRLANEHDEPSPLEDVESLADKIGQDPEDGMVELACEGDDEFKSRWNELRRKHVAALENIEARLSNLGEAVIGMESQLPAKGEESPQQHKRKELLHRALEKRQAAPRNADSEHS